MTKLAEATKDRDEARVQASQVPDLQSEIQRLTASLETARSKVEKALEAANATIMSRDEDVRWLGIELHDTLEAGEVVRGQLAAVNKLKS